MIDRLFVYGTLAPGRPNEHVLGEIGGTWEPARVMGKLRQDGWGADMGYPGIDLDEGSDEIQGFLFSSEALAHYWAMLDEFEGTEYERVLTIVEVNGNRSVDAYIYRLRSR